MNSRFFLSFLIIVTTFSCSNKEELDNKINEVQFNLIQPQNGIYVILKRNALKYEINDNYYEKITLQNNLPIKIERFDKQGKLTDELSTPAVTAFEYNSNNNVKYLRYFDKNGNNAQDELFGYWSIEYIYDELNRVRMEIYRDSENKFLRVPRDDSGNIAKINFLSPVLTYEYINDKIKIKALDQNFNLLKEVLGDKPCVPFIDCGEAE